MQRLWRSRKYAEKVRLALGPDAYCRRDRCSGCLHDRLRFAFGRGEGSSGGLTGWTAILRLDAAEETKRTSLGVPCVCSPGRAAEPPSAPSAQQFLWWD